MSEEIGFKGRVVIVTGSSKGIGHALVTLFAARGAKVVVSGRERGAVEATVADLIAKGGEAIANVGDVSTETGANAIVEQAIQKYGRIDVVVNNAGILNASPVDKMPAAVFDDMMNVNVRSAFLVTRAAWPHMKKQNFGRVILFCSQAIFGVPESVHYSASKGAIFGLMRGLSQEGKPYGINANAIIPFAFTDMVIKSLASGATAAEQSKGVMTAAPELITPAMIAPPVAWLSHENCGISGEMVHAGGGRVAKVFLAETHGFYDPKLSPESVRDHWPEVCEEKNYNVPRDFQDPLVYVMQRTGILPASTNQ